MSEFHEGMSYKDFADFQEAENTAEQIEFTGEDLIAVLSNSKVVEALQVLAQKTAETGHETVFELFVRAKDKEVFIPSLHVGLTDSVSADTEQITAIDEAYLESTSNDDKFGYLLQVHFHPGSEGSIQPSDGDLSQYEKIDALRGAKIIGVARARTNAVIEVLLVHPLGHGYAEPSENYQALSEYMSQDEVNAILQQDGFETHFIRYEPTEAGLVVGQKSLSDLGTIPNFKLAVEHYDRATTL